MPSCEGPIGCLCSFGLDLRNGNRQTPGHLKESSRMNTHKNARLTFARRLEMVQDITQRGLSHAAAAVAQSVSVSTVRKWLGRYLAHGEAALRDRSSRPLLSPRAIAPAKALAIVELRR